VNQTQVIMPDLKALATDLENLRSDLANDLTALRSDLITYLETLISQGEREMTALDDLKAVAADLATDVMDAVTLIQNMHSGGTVADADVEAVVASLTALHTKLSAAAAPSTGP
jgi:hypothetical protein